MKQAHSIDERIKALCEALTGFTQGQDDGALKALANGAPDDALGRLALAIDAAVRPVRAPHSAVARAYFDYALNGILETDYAGRILQANPAACSITGVRRAALIGMRFADLLDTAAGNQDATQKHFALVHEQGIHRSEVMLREQDQTDQTRIIEIASIDVGTEKLLHVFDDVTEQRQLLLDIEAARLAAEEANKAKGNFLANMSHEIRTPLNGVIGLTQLALMTALTPQQEDYLKNIHLSSRHLLTMLNDLLDFSKIEAGRVDYEQIPFSLDEVLDELAPPAAQAARGKALELVFQIGADVPRHLVGDRLRLSQVLSNLLNNAIKFTAAGKVVLSLHSLPVVSRDACLLRICVWDTGIGISANELARLFQPFSQADVSTTRRFGGTGLGLAITKMLVEGMRGNISVASTPGSGSEFIVTLPFVAEMPAGSVSRQALPAARRALVVGSKPVTCDAVRDMLAAEGYAAATARQADAQGAQDLNDLNDLIVIDYDAVLAPDTTLASLFKRHPNLLILVDLETFAAIGPTLAMPAAVELLVKPVAPEALRRALYRLRSKAALPQTRAVAAVQAPQEFAGATILVAEDNRINQQVIGDLLRHAGIHVRLAKNGIEALAAVEQKPPPDLILMDVQMPDMDGLVATRLLRTAGMRLPIVGLSAGVSREEQDRCMNAGMSDFLGKPIDVDELWGVLTRWLPARRHPASQVTSAMASTAIPTLAGIDMDDALPRFLNNFDSLYKTLQMFNAEHGDTAERLQQLHAQEDWPAVAMLLHSVKGASGLLGAKAVAALAKSLEEELRLGRHAAMPPLIDALRAALAVLV